MSSISLSSAFALSEGRGGCSSSRPQGGFAALFLMPAVESQTYVKDFFLSLIIINSNKVLQRNDCSDPHNAN